MRNTHRLSRLFALVVAASSLTLGCGDDTAAPSEPADVAGAWEFTITFVGGGGFSTEFNFAQSGTTVTGSGTVQGSTTATVTGTVSGKKVELTVVQGAPCVGTMTLKATVTDENRMSGTIKGSNCTGAVDAYIDGSRAVPPLP